MGWNQLSAMRHLVGVPQRPQVLEQQRLRRVQVMRERIARRVGVRQGDAPVNPR